jgi:hypothetical protein
VLKREKNSSDCGIGQNEKENDQLFRQKRGTQKSARIVALEAECKRETYSRLERTVTV